MRHWSILLSTALVLSSTVFHVKDAQAQYWRGAALDSGAAAIETVSVSRTRLCARCAPIETVTTTRVIRERRASPVVDYRQSLPIYQPPRAVHGPTAVALPGRSVGGAYPVTLARRAPAVIPVHRGAVARILMVEAGQGTGKARRR